MFERALALLPDDDRTSRRVPDRAWERGDPRGRVGAGAGAARRGDRGVEARRRPAVGAPGDDRAPVAALVHRAGQGGGGGSARRRGRHPRARGDRRPSRAREGVVASQRGARDRVVGGAGASRRAREGDALRTAVPGRGPAAGLSSCSTPRPCTTARRPCPKQSAGARDLLADSPGAPTFEAGLATTLAGLRAMEGRFDEARDAVRRVGRRLRGVRPAVPSRRPRDRRRPDRDPRRRSRRRGARAAHWATPCSRRWASGARARLWPAASPTSCRCRATTARRSGSSTIARETAAETDVMPQVLWRRALARTSSRGAATRRLPRSSSGSAVALGGETDFLDLRAEHACRARRRAAAKPAGARKALRASRRRTRCTCSRGTSRPCRSSAAAGESAA